ATQADLRSVMRSMAPNAVLRRALAAATLVAGIASLARADCPTATLQIFGCPPEEIAGPTATGTRLDCDASKQSGVSYHFRGYGDSVYYACSGQVSFSTLTVRGRYRYLGPDPGVPVTGHAQFRAVVSMHNTAIIGPCSQTTAQLSLLQDQSVEQSATWHPHNTADNICDGSADTTVVIDCSHPSGTELELARQIDLSLGISAFGGNAHVSLRTSFVGLSPGAVVVRCEGDRAQVLGVGPGFVSALRIDMVEPNPARGSFRAALSLPAGGPTFVRLLDVSGRVVDARVVDASPGARRELTFGGGLP